MKLPRNTFCGQTNRREFIHNIGGGFASTALTGMLAGDGFFNKASATFLIESKAFFIKMFLI